MKIKNSQLFGAMYLILILLLGGYTYLNTPVAFRNYIRVNRVTNEKVNIQADIKKSTPIALKLESEWASLQEEVEKEVGFSEENDSINVVNHDKTYNNKDKEIDKLKEELNQIEK